MGTKLLAIDTATEACSAALWVDGTVYAQDAQAPNRHSELLLPMIEDVLARGAITLDQLDAVAWGRGPGAFTGLRIGAAIVQGMAFGCDIPVISVSSLHALAQRHKVSQVLVAIDARMEQVYWACYRREGGHMTRIGNERLTSPQGIVAPHGGRWLAVGSGWDRYLAEMKAVLSGVPVCHIVDCCPHAEQVAEIAARVYSRGGSVPADLAQPCYLRNRVVTG
jgi:tRNA threonylcarbamoyladenosine biosynthesis protein TsaB